MRISLYKIFILLLFTALISTATLSAKDDVCKIKSKAPVENKNRNKVEIITNVMKGVKESNFNTKDRILTIKYNPNEINSDEIVAVLNNVGYYVKEIQEPPKNAPNKRAQTPNNKDFKR